MRVAAIDHLAGEITDLSKPVVITQAAAPLLACTQLTLSGLALAGITAPLYLLAAHAATAPAGLATFAERSGSMTVLLSGLALATGLLTVPLRAGLARLARSAAITLSRDRVDVVERGPLGTCRWGAPTASFIGVTHHLRATVSGPRHEIILVHPEPGKDVLLALSSRPPADGPDHYARLLGLQVIAPRELYGRRLNAIRDVVSGTMLQPATA